MSAHPEGMRCFYVQNEMKGNDTMKRKITAVLTVAVLAFSMCMFTGCTLMNESDRVTHNISKEADNFNVTRRIEVINARTDKPLFELVGNFSLKNNSSNELEIIVEVEPDVYKKHYIYLSEYTMYVVEDVSGAYVDKYHYEVNYLPEIIAPIKFTCDE